MHSSSWVTGVKCPFRSRESPNAGELRLLWLWWFWWWLLLLLLKLILWTRSESGADAAWKWLWWLCDSESGWIWWSDDLALGESAWSERKSADACFRTEAANCLVVAASDLSFRARFSNSRPDPSEWKRMMWCRRLRFSLNPLPHTLQMHGLYPVWTRSCRWTEKIRSNVLSQ